MSVFLLILTVLTAACIQNPEAEKAYPTQRFDVVRPGDHPSLLFSAQELPELRRSVGTQGLTGEAWERVLKLCEADPKVRYEGDWAAHRLSAMALVYQITDDSEVGRRAVEYFQEKLAENEPFSFYKEVDSNFFETEHWPKAFAYGWDWLYPVMTDEERHQILSQLENWCKALYQHTDAWWWRDASYNCGAIPVGALGLLCVAIQGETQHPEFQMWLDSCVRRIRDNYFPTAWRSNGICYEGPCYAQYHKNATQFAEALRRTGGEDIVKKSGAVNAMRYQTFQWMPQGGCGPIGDNTNYGRRVFAAAYLLGIGEMRDSASLWTFEKYTDRGRLDPVLTFLWYPEELESVSPGEKGWPTSAYFEITPNRAGYVYSRSAWDKEKAHYFAFTTRYSGANHQHYDMNSFLFHAFGEEFGTHRNIYSYSHPNHGADLEHNIVIVDGGGWPANDRPNSAGDDCSTNGLLVGLGLGHFADYARGDAKDSYRDNSVAGSCPAIRADRTCLFVKQGPNPYLFVVDDIQQSPKTHTYDWQWYGFDLDVTGSGVPADPFLIEGKEASCGITFFEPHKPGSTFEIVGGTHPRRALEMGLLKVRQKGSRVRFVALASAWEHGSRKIAANSGPEVIGNPNAVSLKIEGKGHSDLLIWQPEETPDSPAPEVSCGELTVQGYLALVRYGIDGEIKAYVLAEGGKLVSSGRTLVESSGTVSVSADSRRVWVTGQLLSRLGDGPIPASAAVLLPSEDAELYVDGHRVRSAVPDDGMVFAGRPSTGTGQ